MGSEKHPKEFFERRLSSFSFDSSGSILKEANFIFLREAFKNSRCVGG